MENLRRIQSNRQKERKFNLEKLNQTVGQNKAGCDSIKDQRISEKFSQISTKISKYSKSK